MNTKQSETSTILTESQLVDLCQRTLHYHGFSDDQVTALTETLIAAEMDGCRSHGIYRLLVIVDTVRKGCVKPDAVPVVEDVAPGVVKVDARGGLSPLAFNAGIELLQEKASHSGIAVLAINHCLHVTALWVEVEKLAQRGLVAIACNPTHSYVAPYGGTTSLLGTNPIAFGWPRQSSPPFVFDFATSMIARGDIEIYRRENKLIPEGWGVDREGKPCQDPGEVLDHGAMLPFGEHKGSALSIMIELLAGPLISDMTSLESTEYDEGKGGIPCHGEIIIAIDPTCTMGKKRAGQTDSAERLFKMIVEQGARLPSQRRFAEREESARKGVEIDRKLLIDIEALVPKANG